MEGEAREASLGGPFGIGIDCRLLPHGFLRVGERMRLMLETGAKERGAE
jgi:hypothetical protein